jgi:hypothetical protein
MKAQIQQIPLVVEFTSGSRVHHEGVKLESETPSSYVVLPSGEQIEIPSDQVVLDENAKGQARVGFGGMSFEGVEDDRLVFWRVRDLLPESLLPSSTTDKLTLDPQVVSAVRVQGVQVWPRTPMADDSNRK